jgi:RNA polymerase sigma-70 factor (ECF subfamily)
MAENPSILSSEQVRQEPDELALVRAARQDPALFGELYLHHAERVYRYLYSRIGNTHEAEDLTAQTFLAAFESFGSFRQDAHFASWLFSIARHKAMDHFRRGKSMPVIEEIQDVPVEKDPLSEVTRSEQVQALAALLPTLPEKDQELLRLRFLAEMSFPEMARFFRQNESALKKSFYRLLEKLHNRLEVQDE